MMQKLENNNSSFKLKIAFVILVFTIVAGMGTYSASAANTNSQDEQISFFDPFELTVYYLNISDNGSNATISGGAGILHQANLQEVTAIIVRPQIRVPYRPPFRSPFRPPWTHPPTAPWYPGNPPWNP